MDGSFSVSEGLGNSVSISHERLAVASSGQVHVFAWKSTAQFQGHWERIHTIALSGWKTCAISPTRLVVGTPNWGTNKGRVDIYSVGRFLNFKKLQSAADIDAAYGSSVSDSVSASGFLLRQPGTDLWQNQWAMVLNGAGAVVPGRAITFKHPSGSGYDHSFEASYDGATSRNDDDRDGRVQATGVDRGVLAPAAAPHGRPHPELGPPFSKYFPR